MSITETETVPAVLVGETAAALLPADDAWSVDAGIDHPAGATVAVGAQMGDHVVAVVLSASMDRRIQVGPPPAEAALDGLQPALEAVAGALGIGELGEIVSMDPAAVAAETPAHAWGATLTDGEEHLVTIVVTPPAPATGETAPESVEFQPIDSGGGGFVGQSGLEVLHEVQMGVTVELGRTRMLLRDILSIVPGSVIELDRAASAPVDVLVNGTLIARGEVVVIDEEFGLRITEVIGHDQTLAEETLLP